MTRCPGVDELSGGVPNLQRELRIACGECALGFTCSPSLGCSLGGSITVVVRVPCWQEVSLSVLHYALIRRARKSFKIRITPEA